jgi:phenylpropionate dioxygenase-like ring-hydroxylating dioxygenase large terminal subunit
MFKIFILLFMLVPFVWAQSALANGCSMHIPQVQDNVEMSPMMDCHKNISTAQEGVNAPCAHCVACHMVFLNFEDITLLQESKASFESKVAENIVSYTSSLDVPPPKLIFS